MRTLTISDIKLPVVIGVYDFEKKQPTVLTVHISISYPLSTQSSDTVSKTDDLSHALNYDDILEVVRTVQKQQPFNLIETVGEKLVSSLKQFCSLRLSRAHLNVLTYNLMVEILKPYPKQNENEFESVLPTHVSYKIKETIKIKGGH